MMTQIARKRSSGSWGMDTASDDPTDAPRFSFELICAALDIDADYLRGGLRRWRETQLERRRVEASGAAAVPCDG